jgi:hypothetical protein
MTSSPINELHSSSPSPIAERGDDIDVANDDQGQNWLTIRRRCELCKQRKVRAVNNSASIELARFYSTLEDLYFQNYGVSKVVQHFSMVEARF